MPSLGVCTSYFLLRTMNPRARSLRKYKRCVALWPGLNKSRKLGLNRADRGKQQRFSWYSSMGMNLNYHSELYLLYKGTVITINLF